MKPELPDARIAGRGDRDNVLRGIGIALAVGAAAMVASWSLILAFVFAGLGLGGGGLRAGRWRGGEQGGGRWSVSGRLHDARFCGRGLRDGWLS